MYMFCYLSCVIVDIKTHYIVVHCPNKITYSGAGFPNSSSSTYGIHNQGIQEVVMSTRMPYENLKTRKLVFKFETQKWAWPVGSFPHSKFGQLTN